MAPDLLELSTRANGMVWFNYMYNNVMMYEVIPKAPNLFVYIKHLCVCTCVCAVHVYMYGSESMTFEPTCTCTKYTKIDYATSKIEHMREHAFARKRRARVIKGRARVLNRLIQ